LSHLLKEGLHVKEEVRRVHGIFFQEGYPPGSYVAEVTGVHEKGNGVYTSFRVLAGLGVSLHEGKPSPVEGDSPYRGKGKSTESITSGYLKDLHGFCSGPSLLRESTGEKIPLTFLSWEPEEESAAWNL